SVHGMGGLLGLLLVPVTNPDATILGQLAGAATILVWVFVVSTIAWLALRLTVGIRVDAEEEYEGLDIGECGLEAYPEFVKS
nr:ammonium transporter [Xanthomonadales bacterium]NIX13797.1 ammonium transporter [Xanthomonadales bacterium]